MQLDGLDMVPLEDQAVAPLLAQWSANRTFPDTPWTEGDFAAGWLGDCTRKIGFRLARVERSNPMDEGGFYATGLGSLVHDAIQAEALGRPPWTGQTVVEMPWRLVVGDVVIASAADVVVMDEDGEMPLEVIDIKSTAPFGFRKKVTSEGPDRGALLQIAAAMRALGAPSGRLVLVSQSELKGRDRLRDPDFDGRANRFAEWTFSMATVDGLLDEELRRLARIKAHVDAGKTVPASIPGSMPHGARVVDVGVGTGTRKGTWQLWTRPPESIDPTRTPVLEDVGEVWQCGYCDWRDRCHEIMTGVAS